MPCFPLRCDTAKHVHFITISTLDDQTLTAELNDEWLIRMLARNIQP